MSLRRLTQQQCLVPATTCSRSPSLTVAMRSFLGPGGGGSDTSFARGMNDSYNQAGPDRSGSTMSSNPAQFEKSFEKVIGTIQERHPFQVVKGNPYDIQFGEVSYLGQQEKSKEMASGKETEGAREKLRDRLVGGPPLTPEGMGADPMQKLARERIREKLDPRILKESKEAPEFYYENQSPLAAKWDMFKSSGLFVLSLFVMWLAFYFWWRNDTSNVADEPVEYYVSAYKKKKEAEEKLKSQQENSTRPADDEIDSKN